MDQQLKERGRLQEKILAVRKEHNETMLQIRQDIGRYMEMKEKKEPEETFKFTLEQPAHTYGGYAME